MRSGMTPGAVRITQHRALTKLRRVIQNAEAQTTVEIEVPRTTAETADAADADAGANLRGRREGVGSVVDHLRGGGAEAGQRCVPCRTLLPDRRKQRGELRGEVRTGLDGQQ